MKKAAAPFKTEVRVSKLLCDPYKTAPSPSNHLLQACNASHAHHVILVALYTVDPLTPGLRPVEATTLDLPRAIRSHCGNPSCKSCLSD